MSLPGLPPLPKSLSGFKLSDFSMQLPPTPVRTSSMRSTSSQHSSNPLIYESSVQFIPVSSSSRKVTNLDTKLSILKQEMYNLRQLDLTLLSQLWSLNESLQEFRQILQDQDRVLSPPSPSPTPSSGEDIDGEEFYMSATSLSFRSSAPAAPGRRTSNSSNTSSLG